MVKAQHNVQKKKPEEEKKEPLARTIDKVKKKAE
jgi:hypothetical protein